MSLASTQVFMLYYEFVLLSQFSYPHFLDLSYRKLRFFLDLSMELEYLYCCPEAFNSIYYRRQIVWRLEQVKSMCPELRFDFVSMERD